MDWLNVHLLISKLINSKITNENFFFLRSMSVYFSVVSIHGPLLNHFLSSSPVSSWERPLGWGPDAPYLGHSQHIALVSSHLLAPQVLPQPTFGGRLLSLPHQAARVSPGIHQEVRPVFHSQLGHLHREVPAAVGWSGHHRRCPGCK